MRKTRPTLKRPWMVSRYIHYMFIIFLLGSHTLLQSYKHVIIIEKTRAFFCESVSNPALEICDLEVISASAHKHGLPLIVDSTFSTPYLCKPFEHGADIVVSSLTKWVGGHGAGLGGIIVDKGGFNWGGGKHPLYDEPDTSYSGMRWGHDLPDALQPLSFILRARTVPLRNLGACLSRELLIYSILSVCVLILMLVILTAVFSYDTS